MSCAALHFSNGGSKMLTPSASRTNISSDAEFAHCLLEKDLLVQEPPHIMLGTWE